MDCTCSISTVTGRELPVVYRWPYDYSNPNYEEDFVPQNVPMKEGEEVLHH
jgi:cytochrome c oxidase subunit 1